jgi:hypothetical protein
MSALFCVVQPSGGIDFATGRSPVQGVLPKCLKGYTVPEVVIWNRPEGLIRLIYKQASKQAAKSS